MAEVEESLQIWSRSTYLAQLELAQDNVAAAKESYIDALNASIAMRRTYPIFYAQTQVALASVYLMDDDARSSIALLCDVLPVYEKYYGRVHPKMVEVYHLLACVHHQYGLPVEAKLWYEACLECMGALGIEGGDKAIVIENYVALLDHFKLDLGKRIFDGADCVNAVELGANYWCNDSLGDTNLAEGVQAIVGLTEYHRANDYQDEDEILTHKMLVDVLMDVADNWGDADVFASSSECLGGDGQTVFEEREADATLSKRVGFRWLSTPSKAA